MTEQNSAGMHLQAYEARLLRRPREPASRRLRITAEMETVDELSVENHREVWTVQRDLVLIPFADGTHNQLPLGRLLERVDRIGAMDRCTIRPCELVDLDFEPEIDSYNMCPHRYN